MDRKPPAPKCPYLFINIPGERPFVMERLQYESLTQGITIVETTLTKQNVYIDRTLIHTSAQGPVKDVWVYTIKHVTPSRNGRNIRGTIRLFNLLQTRWANRFWEFRDIMIEWGQKVLKTREVANAPKVTKHEKTIRRLEKEMAKLYAHRPHHPLAPRDYKPDRHGEHNYWLNWHEQKISRQRIGMIAGWLLRGQIKETAAYKLLAEAGFNVEKFSKLRKYDRDRAQVNPKGYWASLYLFTTGLQEKRKYQDTTPDAEDFESHATARIRFLETSREIKSIKTQIESIRQLAGIKTPVLPAEVLESAMEVAA